MNKQFADMSLPAQSNKFTHAKVQRHIPNQAADNFNPMLDLNNNECARSMTSEQFSQFSMPSNNFINGLKVNVFPQSAARRDQPEMNMINSMTSQEFSSVMKSNPTVNQVNVNLSQPGTLNNTQKMNGAAPLQMC